MIIGYSVGAQVLRFEGRFRIRFYTLSFTCFSIIYKFPSKCVSYLFIALYVKILNFLR